MSGISNWDIIRRPRLTEKANRLKEQAERTRAKGREAGDTFIFDVDPRANKIQIRAAVEQVFGVEVLHVRTVNMAGKKRRYGRFLGFKPDWKKAYVTLKPGSKTIDYHEG